MTTCIEADLPRLCALARSQGARDRSVGRQARAMHDLLGVVVRRAGASPDADQLDAFAHTLGPLRARRLRGAYLQALTAA